MAILVTLFGVVVALLAVVIVGMLRGRAETIRSVHDLGVVASQGTTDLMATARTGPLHRAAGGVAADISGIEPTGDPVTVVVGGTPHSTLLVFLTTTCTTCADLWHSFGRPRSQVPGVARLVVVTKGAEAESRARLRDLAPPGVEVVMSSAAWDDYDVPVAPYFVLVDGPTAQLVGETVAGSWKQVEQMIEPSS